MLASDSAAKGIDKYLQPQMRHHSADDPASAVEPFLEPLHAQLAGEGPTARLGKIEAGPMHVVLEYCLATILDPSCVVLR